jgi:hypothetical protein
MSDQPIPAMWGKTTAQKLTEADLDQTIAERRAFIPQGCDQQGCLVPTIPAEACTELGCDDWEPAGFGPWIYIIVSILALSGAISLVVANA